MYAFILIACNPTKQALTTSGEPSYVFDDQRIDRIANMCVEMEAMLNDTTVPAKKLNLLLAQTVDTLEFVVRHCQDFEFNKWVRGYGRHIMMDVILDKRPDENVKNRFFTLPYGWTILQEDSTTLAFTTMFRGSGEIHDRFVNINLFVNTEYQKCMFVVCNYADTIIENMTIEFFDDESNVIATLHISDAEFTDDSDYDAGILRVIFPLETFMPLYGSASAVHVSYDAKNEQILMMHPFLKKEKSLLREFFNGNKDYKKYEK
jgi:hypothetical protein